MYSSIQATRASVHHKCNIYVHNRLGTAFMAGFTGISSFAAMLYGYYAASSYEIADAVDILAISISFILAFATLPFGLAAIYSSKGRALAITGLIMAMPGLLLFVIAMCLFFI